MPRPKRQFKTKEARERHEAALAKRRARNHDKRTIRMAEKAAEGSADFQELVEAEKQRHQTLQQAGGSKSPKVTVKARESLAAAFDLMGGVPALVVWGRQNPTEFYRLWARLIPKESEETAGQLPLESLLEKLASKEEKSVGQAAWEIGMETLEAAREVVEREDALSAGTETLQ